MEAAFRFGFVFVLLLFLFPVDGYHRRNHHRTKRKPSHRHHKPAPASPHHKSDTAAAGHKSKEEFKPARELFHHRKKKAAATPKKLKLSKPARLPSPAPSLELGVERIFREALADVVDALDNATHLPWWVTGNTAIGALRVGDNFGYSTNRVQIPGVDLEFMLEIHDDADWYRVKSALRRFILSKTHPSWSWATCQESNPNVAPSRKSPKLTCYIWDAEANVPGGVVNAAFSSYVVSSKLNQIAMDPVCFGNSTKCKGKYPFQAWGGNAPYLGLFANKAGQFPIVKYGDHTLRCVYDPIAIITLWNSTRNQNGPMQRQRELASPTTEYCLAGIGNPRIIPVPADNSPSAILERCEKSMYLYRDGYASFYPLHSKGCANESKAAGRSVARPVPQAQTCEAFLKRQCPDEECMTTSFRHYNEVFSSTWAGLNEAAHTPWWVVEGSLFGALTWGGNFGVTPKHLGVMRSSIKFMVEISTEDDWTRIKASLRKIFKEKSGYEWSWSGCSERNDGIAPVRTSPKLVCRTTASLLGKIKVSFHSYVVSRKLNRIAMDPVCLTTPSKCKGHWPFQAWGGAAPYKGLITNADGFFSRMKFSNHVLHGVFDPIAFLKKFNNREYGGGSSEFHVRQHGEYCLSGTNSKPLISKPVDKSPEAILALCRKSLELHHDGFLSFYPLYSKGCKKEYKNANTSVNAPAIANTCLAYLTRTCTAAPLAASSSQCSAEANSNNGLMALDEDTLAFVMDSKSFD